MDDVRVLIGPPRWSWAVWALLGAHILRMVWRGPTWSGLIVGIGIASIALAWERHLNRRALWLTEEEVIISNSSGTHVVPKAGASATLVRVEPAALGSKPKWDNTQTAVRRLYVIPGNSSLERVQVEAAQGISPRKLRGIVDELEAAFKEAS